MKVWVTGARPRTLPAAVAPVVVASALAGNDFAWAQALIALVVSLLLQIGVNYANDYSDGVKGTDANRIGPTRITASGLAQPAAVKRAAFLSFGGAALAGLYLAYTTTWWLILVGFLAIIAAWGYTGGKNPYGYLGLGEIFVFLFFGVVATCGTFYVQTQTLTKDAVVASISIGFFACALLAINNIRDRAQDALVGKRTLAVRLGDKNSRIFFALLIAAGYGCGIAASWPFGALTLLSLPVIVPAIQGLKRGASGVDLIPLLGRTGQVQLVYSALFTISILLAR